MNTAAETYRRYQALTRRWQDARDLDARFGTNYAADLVAPMRAAYAAYRAATAA